MGATSEISVRADPRSVPMARNFVIDFARQAEWLADAQIESLRLAASELITNAIAAQIKSAPDGEIQIACDFSNRKLTVRITDTAGGFELPADFSLPEPSLDQETGFGLAIADALADDVSFTRLADGTGVTLTFRR